MGIIVAIGGGELRKLETILIDQKIVSLTNKTSPKALFIPTASHEATSYIKLFEDIYGKRLGCVVDTLYLNDDVANKGLIKDKILSADLIYVGGGDTAYMLDLWRKYEVDKYIIQAYHQGCVLSGLSAGAICWFEYGYSDSESFSAGDNQWQYKMIEGLGLIKGAVCPHYEQREQTDFKLEAKNLNAKAIGLDSNMAYIINNGEVQIIRSQPNQNVD